MTQAPDTRTIYDGRLISMELARFRTAEGHEVEREVVRHPGAVLIIPVGAGETVTMIRNHRVAVGRWVWEFPAGTFEPGETAIDTARRELSEETGLRCGRSRIEPIGSFYTSPGFTDELMQVFVAGDLSDGEQQLELHESIEVHRLPVSRVREMISDGTLMDGKSIAAFLLWMMRTDDISSKERPTP